MEYHNAMTSKQVQIKNVTLLARERKSPPTGELTADRDIGFASVFLSVENLKEENTNIMIKSIQVINISDGAAEAFTQSPSEIHLHPLENSENAFYLSNKTGYSGRDKVKAVVTYQIAQKTYVVESHAVEVDRM